MRKLLVCDMAGTVINEGGRVYRVLGNVLSNIGVPRKDLHMFHGMCKREAIRKGIMQYTKGDEETVNLAHRYFKKELKKEYRSGIRLVHPSLPFHFYRLRKRGVHIALNTGYDREILNEILYGLRLDVDYTIASNEVERGRPSSDMIDALVERSGATEVIKIGDTKLDVEEGKNAGAYTIGVLSGAGSYSDLQEADLIVPNIMRVIVNDKII